MPTVRSNLVRTNPVLADPQEHRHSFVRKNAVFAVYSIYQDHEHLIPDAPELLDTFLAAESDSTCKRNAFVTLCNISQSTAVRYLLSNFDAISGMDELMQMAVIELVRKEAKTEGGHRVSLRFTLLTPGKMDPLYLRTAQLPIARCQVRGRHIVDFAHPKPCSSKG